MMLRTLIAMLVVGTALCKFGKCCITSYTTMDHFSPSNLVCNFLQVNQHSSVLFPLHDAALLNLT